MPRSDEGVIEWVNDGHQLKLGVEVNLGDTRTCLSCGALRGHLDLDYICIECRVSNGHGVPWHEIEVTHTLICPFEQMTPGKRVPMEALEIPLFEKIPIVYYLDVRHYPGTYDTEPETDIEFGWLPANLADFKQGR